MFKSNRNPQFRSKFSEDIFNTKYSHTGAETMHELACTLVEDVCQSYLTRDEKDELIDHMSNLRFLPGGRYLYYAGRERNSLIIVTFFEQKKIPEKIGLTCLGSLSHA